MIRNPTITKILCVALVAALMLPIGGELYPYFELYTGAFGFDAAEAVVSATLGFFIHSVLFG
jgi:hypothetical protein